MSFSKNHVYSLHPANNLCYEKEKSRIRGIFFIFKKNKPNMRKLTLLMLILASVTIQAQSKKMDKMIDNVESKVIEWRRDFHQNPELSNREFKTAEKI